MKKKTLLLIAMCLLVAAPSSFAQTKLVKEVERMAKKDNANLKEARNLIKPALTNPETENDARAWYVAGLVEEKEVERGFLAQQMQKEINMNQFYEAVYNMADYYMKADELDAMPNDKGRVRRKYENEIKNGLQTYYGFLVNGGAEYLNNNDFANAHKYFDKFMQVKAMPIFEGTPVAEQDSLSMEIGFFNAYAATQIEDNNDKAIELLNSIKDVPYRQEEVYQLLAVSHLNNKDTVSYRNTLQEGADRFPSSQFFLGNMINLYLNKGDYDQAKAYLQKVLESDVENKEMYYNALADIYSMQEDYAKAEETYQKAIELNPGFADAVMGIGRMYYNRALKTANEATENITNEAKMKELDAQAQELFRKALPFLEKAVKLDGENKEYLMALRNVYYNLKMNDEFNAIEAQLQQ